MAASRNEASSSSSLSFPCSYHVFLSFRGKDTRTTFTDHLYTALNQAAIHTFRDDDEIERGEDIKKELEKAIQQSKVKVIVFSPDYASSRWCLDELVLINEQRKDGRGHILPIFYHVTPDLVRKQSGSFGEAFVRHEDRYKESPEKLEKWRSALKEVADLSGEVLKDQHEATFVQKIVRHVHRKLDRKLLYVESPLVGMDCYVKLINLWLQNEPTDFRILIIHGMCRVVKTTIAKTVYNNYNDKFEKCCFLKNVRETSQQPNGVHNLQEQILHDMGRSEKIYNTDQGIIKIEEAICCRKVLIVVNDLDDLKQFKQIIARPECLSSGSKIVITSRNVIRDTEIPISSIHIQAQQQHMEGDLLEGCKATILSFSTPGEKCSLSTISQKPYRPIKEKTVSHMFNNATTSDTVSMETFLPPDNNSIISLSSDPNLVLSCSNEKQLFHPLCNTPILIDNDRKSFSLDKKTGKKCFMLSARDLSNTHGDTPEYWRWTSSPYSRFPEVTELIKVCWIEQVGRMNTNMLSHGTNYGAYLVFRLMEGHKGILLPAGAEGKIRIKEKEKSRRNIDMRLAVEREDGWKEVVLGEYFNKDGRDGELEILFLKNTEDWQWQHGLLVEGIEIRPC